MRVESLAWFEESWVRPLLSLACPAGSLLTLVIIEGELYMKTKCCFALVLGLVSVLSAVLIFPQVLGTKSIPLARGKPFAPNTYGSPVTYYGGPVMPGVVNVYPHLLVPQ